MKKDIFWFHCKRIGIFFLKISVIVLPWCARDSFERPMEEVILPEKTKKFVEKEMKKHEDLKNYHIHPVEWNRSIYAISSHISESLRNQYFILIPQELNKRLITFELNKKELNKPIHWDSIVQQKNFLLIDKFSFHHELGHLVYHHKEKKNILTSVGLSGIMFTINLNKSLFHTWIKSMVQTLLLLYVIQYFSRCWELESDLYAINGPFFKPEEKIIIAKQWMAYANEEERYGLPHHLLKGLFGSHPNHKERSKKIIDYLRSQIPT